MTGEKHNIGIDFDEDKYIMVRISDQRFGLSIDNIKDILKPHNIAPVPLAPKEVRGTLNLRGRIVTALDLSVKLGLVKDGEDAGANKNYRNVVVEQDGELYSLIVDEVAEILNIPAGEITAVPENLSEDWKYYSKGVFPMQDDLMIMLDVERLIKFEKKENKDEKK